MLWARVVLAGMFWRAEVGQVVKREECVKHGFGSYIAPDRVQVLPHVHLHLSLMVP